jgi:hypothetical protein
MGGKTATTSGKLTAVLSRKKSGANAKTADLDHKRKE